RLRGCRGSERDSKWEAMDSTFTHLAAIRDTPVTRGDAAVRVTRPPRAALTRAHGCTTVQPIAQAHAACPSMRAGRGLKATPPGPDPSLPRATARHPPALQAPSGPSYTA